MGSGRVWRLAAGLTVIAALAGGGRVLAPPATSGEDPAGRRKTLVPLPSEAPAPKHNATTPEKVALGRQLFFDPRLSGDNTMSCATCHLPQKGFADGLPLGKGHKGNRLHRNTPTVLNVGFHARLFRDGRAGSLEEQALGPIQSPDEMNQDLDELEKELNAVAGYVEQFQQVFGTSVTRTGIARALASFERSLVTKPSPFDRFLEGDRSALSASALRGYELFVGEAGCIRCHHGPLLSDGEYYRLGVSLRDAGRAAVTGKTADRAKLRTPSLRNVSRTAPYMHDGSLATLSDVVTFYYRGVPSSSELPLDVQSLSDRSYSEISDLVAFLDSLTGDEPDGSPPALP